MKGLTYFISCLFHPLLLSTILCSMLFISVPELDDGYSDKITWLILVFVFVATFLIPFLSVVMLKVSNIVLSLDMKSREERVIPFSLVAFFYFVTTIIFAFKLDLHFMLILMMAVNTSILILHTIITLRYKVSMHSAGICGMIGFLLGVLYVFPSYYAFVSLLVCILFSGIVMSSRLYLGAHTLDEIVSGGILGFLISFVVVILSF